MRIHTISTYQEFTDKEIQETINWITKKLSSIKEELDDSGGLIVLTIKTTEISYKLHGFGLFLEMKIKRLLKSRH